MEQSKTVTAKGKAALNYIANPKSFPSDCPDPRKDAQGFSDWLNRHPEYC